MWFSILAIESLILDRLSFLETFWSTLVRLNKCNSHAKTSDHFGFYLLALIKKFIMKKLKFLFFPTYVPVTLIKSKLQIHPLNPANPDILKVMTKYL